MIRRAIAGLGRTLIATGVLLLFFVAYQLWGTGIAEARSQRTLRSDLAVELGIDPTLVSRLGDDPSVTLPSTAGSGAPGSNAGTPVQVPEVPEVPDVVVPEIGSGPVSTADPPLSGGDPATVSVPPQKGPPRKGPPPTTVFRSKRPQLALRTGQGLGFIRLPKIHVVKAFVEGTAVEDLKHGPGHYSGTRLPGEPGLAAIAGHRTTYGNPFYDMDRMKPGDPIIIADKLGVFRYITRELKVVKPTDSSVLDDDGTRNLLVLTTCHPKLSARQRLVLIAELEGPGVEADIIEPTTIPAATIPVKTIPVTTVPVTIAAKRARSRALSTPAAGHSDPAIELATIPVPPETEPSVPPTAKRSSGPANGSGYLANGERTSTIHVDSRNYALGWFAGPSAVWRATIGWALLGAAIWFGSWFVARRRRRIIARLGVYAMGLVPFLFALFYCYEHLARLLPENI